MRLGDLLKALLDTGPSGSPPHVLPINRLSRIVQGLQDRTGKMLNVRETLPSLLENSRAGNGDFRTLKLVTMCTSTPAAC